MELDVEVADPQLVFRILGRNALALAAIVRERHLSTEVDTVHLGGGVRRGARGDVGDPGMRCR